MHAHLQSEGQSLRKKSLYNLGHRINMKKNCFKNQNNECEPTKHI